MEAGVEKVGDSEALYPLEEQEQSTRRFKIPISTC
jgi:hypothetical protein